MLIADKVTELFHITDAVVPFFFRYDGEKKYA